MDVVELVKHPHHKKIRKVFLRVIFQLKFCNNQHCQFIHYSVSSVVLFLDRRVDVSIFTKPLGCLPALFVN